MLGRIANSVLILHLVVGSYAWSNGGAEDNGESATKHMMSSTSRLAPSITKSSKPRLRQSAMHSDGASLAYQDFHFTANAVDMMLNTLLCKDRGCSDACQTYLTPINKCFNGQSLFPDDPSWSEYDILDTYDYMYLERKGVREAWRTNNGVDSANMDTLSRRGKQEEKVDLAKNFDDASSSFKRIFFLSKDSSCLDPTDEFDALPLNECVGPFGDPRPWGRFEIAAARK